MAGMRSDPRNVPPTAQTGKPAATASSGVPYTPPENDEWLELARSAFYSSTSYVDTNYRKSWEDSIRAFNSQHSSDSKYSQPAYEKRSRIFRPKIRAVIRKNEAAAAAAFFSNMDVVNVSATDKTSKAEAASAAIMKELLQYRLTKSVPWYQIVLGGIQDAQNTGVVLAHVHWEYEEIPGEEIEETPAQEAGEATPDTEYPEQGELPLGASVATAEGHLETSVIAEPVVVMQAGQPKVVKDRPAVDLIPVENLRIDPGANWMDPINTSPYLIHLIPMYVIDVKARMETGEWNKLSDALIGAATELSMDSTRAARNKGRDDPYNSSNSSIEAYTIVWVQRHIHKKDGQDWEFYTMGDMALLTAPRPLEETVFHGMRPYVMGCCVLETHKIYPSSLPQLGKGLIDETNEVANQRLDNVKFVLNKKWFVKRGREADIAGLVRNVPGGVVMLDDPINDVREISWNDVTASAFQEQQGISMELDELLGNFNPASIMTQPGAQNSPARNMAMLSNSQGTLVEYLIRTYVETFVQPVLRHLVKLEQKYETDMVVLKIASKQANVYQRYGVDEATDALLDNELTLSVNVGMGATDPMQKLQKFLFAMNSYTGMMAKPTPGVNMPEVGKEIFGLLGYSDGTRFFTIDNPQVAQMQQQLQQAMQVIQQLQGKAKEKETGHVVSLQKAREKNQTEIQKTVIQETNENKRALATHFRAIVEARNKPQTAQR
jgi:hypothetical protein